MSEINTINCKFPSFGLRDFNTKKEDVFNKYLLFYCMHVFSKFFFDYFQAFESSLTINSESIKKF